MIVGTPRSGTTLVQRLAAELPGVAVPPETHFFSLFLPGLVARRSFPLSAPEIRAEVGTFMRLKTSAGLDLDADEVVEELAGVCNQPLDLFAGILRVLAPNAALVGEKTPNHLLWAGRVLACSPELKLIVVVRDPRAVAASYRRTWGTQRYWVTAQRWRSDQHRALALLRSAPQRALLLRYEDVARDPATARGAIAHLLGVRGEASAEPRPPATLPWETWKRQATGEITADRIDAWTSVLSSAESGTVAHICRRLMTRFDYPCEDTRLPSPRQQRDRIVFGLRRTLKTRRIARTPLAGAAVGS